jgi:hypothetical protein
VRTDPKSKGERSEGMILATLLRAGKAVLQPFGDNQRYDLVIDEDGKFIRVQCKTARLHENRSVLAFSTCSSQTHRGKGTQNYRGQIELFGVYSPDLDKVYFVPVESVGFVEARLRLTPATNGQTKGVRLASEFEFDPRVPYSFSSSSVGRARHC